MADIRSYFSKQQQGKSDRKGGSKKKTTSGPVIIDDDDDNGNDFKQRRSKRIEKKKIKYDFESDDDNEEVLPKKKPKPSSSPALKGKSSTTTASEFFGSAPIKRSKATTADPVTTTTSKRAPKHAMTDEYPIGSSHSNTASMDEEPLLLGPSSSSNGGSSSISSSSSQPPPAKKLKLLIDKCPVTSDTPSPRKHTLSTDISLGKISPGKTSPGKISPGKTSPGKTTLSKTSLSKTSPGKVATNRSKRNTQKERSDKNVTKARTPEGDVRIKQERKSKTPPIKTKTPPIKTKTPPIRNISESPPQKGIIKKEKQIEGTSPAATTAPPKPSRSSSYQAYLNRGGPKAPGSKEIPEGAPNCLAGLTFVFTGVGESMDKDESTEVAKRFGARVTGNVSRKTSYLVCGEGAGEGKISKARELKVRMIDEDEFLDLIRTRPSGKHALLSTPPTATRKGKGFYGTSSKASTSVKQESTVGVADTTHASPIGQPQTPQSDSKSWHRNESNLTPSRTITAKGTGSGLMLVDKYSPVSTKQIIGQQGEKSNVKKLAKWLREWFDYHGVTPTKKPLYGNSGKSNDGSCFKAALLSGPPGIGKTTSATLVCKEEGFTYTELNASACRGKKTLQTEVATSVGSLSMDAFVEGGGGAEAGKRHVLIMDEVDGMAGNEDRGGVQELIQIIKKSNIPIICICNDRQHIKIRSLANYCFDLRFYKPKVEQIKGSMMSIAYKEGIKVNPQALQEIIIASNNDVRQVLHNMSLWAAMDNRVTSNEAMKSAKKEFKMGPFDVVKSVFLPMEGNRELTLNEKSGLFFQDYSFGPLFVQENYLRVKSQRASNIGELLQAMSSASDAIAYGDLVSKLIRADSHWGLLPVQAMYSSVLPGEYMRGTMGRPEFPQWLGNNSKQGRSGRILQDLQHHTRLVCSCDRTEFGMEYLPILNDRLTRPLLERGSEGVSEVIECMNAYDLTRNDWDSIVELAQYSGQQQDDNGGIMAKLDSKTKAAFTRAYNKSSHSLPYNCQATTTGAAGFRKKSVNEDMLLLEEGEDDNEGSDEEEDSQNAKRYLVKPRKPSQSKPSKTRKKSA